MCAILGLAVQILLPVLHGPHERFADTQRAAGLSLSHASAVHASGTHADDGAICQVCVASHAAGKHLIGTDLPLPRLLVAVEFQGVDRTRQCAGSLVRPISCGPRGPPSLA